MARSVLHAGREGDLHCRVVPLFSVSTSFAIAPQEYCDYLAKRSSSGVAIFPLAFALKVRYSVIRTRPYLVLESL
jgi:hypothetical protein